MTHSELCKIGGNWLKKKCKEKCPVVAIELRAIGNEIPDVFGTNSSHSVIIEVKISRSDFKADLKKIHRINTEYGVGDFRYYMCPAGLIDPIEVPAKWGLLWVNTDGTVSAVKDMLTGNINVRNENKFQKNEEHEKYIMYSILRRLFSKKQYLKDFPQFV